LPSFYSVAQEARLPIGQKEPARPAPGVLPIGGNGSLSLNDPLQYFKGVGPQVGAALGKLGLQTVGDLLRHIPRRWEDRTHFRRVADVQSGEFATLCGVVIAASTTYPKPRMQLTKVLLDDAGSALTLTWFNQPWLEKTFKGLMASRRPV